MTRWAILSGEYPPQPGGVADYSQLLADGLQAAGDEVHVWAPSCDEETNGVHQGVHLHRLRGGFGPTGLLQLHRELSKLERPYQILLQYVPHAFGWKAMNVPFCVWLYGRSFSDSIWVMFHEVAFPISREHSIRHNILGCVTSLMATLVFRAAHRCFMSTRSWLPWIQWRGPHRPIDWLPVPSNIPTEIDIQAVATIRTLYCPNPNNVLIGHFGTFGSFIAPQIESVFPLVLTANRERVGLLLGTGSDQFLRGLIERYPEFAGRVFASGSLPARELANHLAACDLLIQPYPDGVATRRTTVMAGLALGIPIVTTTGPMTEPVWSQERLVVMSTNNSPQAIAMATEELLQNAPARRTLGLRGREGYVRLFSMDCAIATLRTLE
jgi:glycosyltransferase involved in cell wall biosynthesis